ncbi:MAG: hypothetical protein KA352_15195 [Flavobacteriales bacterium]|nr:hypothetical protein [Flavobacteriales bacterium]
MTTNTTFGGARDRKDRIAIVVLCCHGIEDPLVATLILDYTLRLQQRDIGADVLLITEEPHRRKLSAERRAELDRAGILWSPLWYDLSGAQFFQKFRNLFLLAWRAWSFARGYRHRVVLGFLSMTGAYGSILRMLWFHRFIAMNFEPHSLFMKEMGVWGPRSLKYRVIRFFERRTMAVADDLIAPASAVIDHVRSHPHHCTIHLQGVTIDVRKSQRDEVKRRTLRARLGVENATVLFYVGKFGGIYYSAEQYMEFIRRSCSADPRVHHLLVTFPDQIALIRGHGAYAQLEHRITLLEPVPPEHLADYLSAADLGVIAVPPTPSQVFRSPVKTAHYWAAGLPIIIPAGISDDWAIARDRGIGIVVKGLPDLDVDDFRRELDRYATAPQHELMERCVRAAMELRDTGLMVDLLEKLITSVRSDRTASGTL